MPAGDPQALSASTPAARAAPQGQAAPAPRRPMSVLLVEDDNADARLLTEFLIRSRFFAHEVTRVTDQAAAVAAAPDKKFELVILDYWLRTQASLPLGADWAAAFHQTPILLVTSVDAADIQSLALACGADGYLHKNDLSPSALDAVIRTLLHARQTEGRLLAALAQKPNAAGKLRENRAETSHDALSTLNAVHGFAQILSSDSRDVIPGADTSSYIDLIKQGSETLIDILHGYLTRAENPEKTPKLTFRLEDIGKIIKSVALTAQHQCSGMGHTLLVSVIGGPVHAEVDKTAIYQMLLNLVTNAVKYSPRETTMTLVLTDMGERFRIALSDQGVGMSKDEIAAAMQRHMRPPRPEEIDAPGRGLGLAVVSSIVEMHGGAMHIESEKGWGATVNVTLPVKRARLN